MRQRFKAYCTGNSKLRKDGDRMPIGTEAIAWRSRVEKTVAI